MPIQSDIKPSKHAKDIKADAKEQLDIFWLDHDGGGWVPLGAELNFEDGKLTATVKLYHFSQYGLGGCGPIQKWYYQQWYY